MGRSCSSRISSSNSRRRRKRMKKGATGLDRGMKEEIK